MKTQSNTTVVKESRVVFVAVKPHLVRHVLKEVCGSITKDHIIVSIAAGVTLEGMEEVLYIWLYYVRTVYYKENKVNKSASNSKCFTRELSFSAFAR